MRIFAQIQETGGNIDAQALSDGVNGLVEQVKTENVWDIILAGGWYFMAPLAVLLVMAIYIFFERWMAINRANKDEKALLDQVKMHIQGANIQGAKTVCAANTTPMARLLEKGISRIGKPMKDISTSIENAGKLEIYKLEKNLSTLATIAGAAPMIGLLGTVIGMIGTFRAILENGVDLQSLAGGIMQALVTTVGGLIIGILAYWAYNFLTARVEKVIHRMEGTSVEFIDILQEPGN